MVFLRPLEFCYRILVQNKQESLLKIDLDRWNDWTVYMHARARETDMMYASFFTELFSAYLMEWLHFAECDLYVACALQAEGNITIIRARLRSSVQSRRVQWNGFHLCANISRFAKARFFPRVNFGAEKLPHSVTAQDCLHIIDSKQRSLAMYDSVGSF